jgi:hypothetical protein
MPAVREKTNAEAEGVNKTVTVADAKIFPFPSFENKGAGVRLGFPGSIGEKTAGSSPYVAPLFARSSALELDSRESRVPRGSGAEISCFYVLVVGYPPMPQLAKKKAGFDCIGCMKSWIG